MTQTEPALVTPGNLVLAERRGRVLVLTLNRPDRLNAWNDDLEDQYFELLTQADNDPEIGSIVVTGAGRGFCAGADMDDLRSAGNPLDGPASARPLPRSFPLTIRKPLIAAINGAAAGLGLVEALYCDVRLAVPAAKLTTSFARRGLIAEYGAAWLLPRLVGTSVALDLLMSARIVLGDEAAAIGLVNRVVAPESLLDEAISYASDLATLCSPWAMSTIKQQVYEGLATDFQAAVGTADRLMVDAFTRPDAAEGVASFLEARPPSLCTKPTLDT